MRTTVDVTPLREAFERSGMSAYELAQELGWTCPDRDRVLRTLGLSKHRSGGSARRLVRQRTSQEKALAICVALNVDPVDVGL